MGAGHLGLVVPTRQSAGVEEIELEEFVAPFVAQRVEEGAQPLLDGGVGEVQGIDRLAEVVTSDERLPRLVADHPVGVVGEELGTGAGGEGGDPEGGYVACRPDPFRQPAHPPGELPRVGGQPVADGHFIAIVHKDDLQGQPLPGNPHHVGQDVGFGILSIEVVPTAPAGGRLSRHSCPHPLAQVGRVAVQESQGVVGRGHQQLLRDQPLPQPQGHPIGLADRLQTEDLFPFDPQTDLTQLIPHRDEAQEH